MGRDEPQALILDDGELDDVREALAGLGVRTLDDAAASDGAPLLVTTPARARALRAGGHEPRHNLHLVVASAGERAHHGRDPLPGDFLVERPLRSELLRLLVERAGYEGPERRRMTRVALGVPVDLQGAGEQAPRQVILAQLSVGGCGLVASFALETGSPVRLRVPDELVAPRRLVLAGRVSSARPVTTADGETFDVSVVFTPLPLGDRVTVRALMAGQPIDFRPRPGPGGPAAAGGAPKRGVRRRPLAGPDPGGLTRVVIARDLSSAGMQIERDPALALGDRFDVCLYTGADAEPLEVRGTVTADDGDAGWRIAFQDVDDRTRGALAVCRRGADGTEAHRPAFAIAEMVAR